MRLAKQGPLLRRLLPPGAGTARVGPRADEPARVLGHHRRARPPEPAGRPWSSATPAKRARLGLRHRRGTSSTPSPARQINPLYAIDIAPGRPSDPVADRRALRQHQRVPPGRGRAVPAGRRARHRPACTGQRNGEPGCTRQDGAQHHRRARPRTTRARAARVLGRQPEQRRLELVQRHLEHGPGAQDAGRCSRTGTSTSSPSRSGTTPRTRPKTDQQSAGGTTGRPRSGSDLGSVTRYDETKPPEQQTVVESYGTFCTPRAR